LIARITTSELYSFILVGYHSDPHHLKEAAALVEHSLRMVRTRYPEADILVHTDLNADKESRISKRIFSELAVTGWSVLALSLSTRVGYGSQKDSITDFFFISQSLMSAGSANLEVKQGFFPSDHRPLVLW
jgi:hypothetical protein